MRGEINQIEINTENQRNPNWFFEKINKVDKLIARVTKEKQRGHK